MKNFSLLPKGKVKTELKQKHIKTWIFHNRKALQYITGATLPQANYSSCSWQEQNIFMNTFNSLQQRAPNLSCSHVTQRTREADNCHLCMLASCLLQRGSKVEESQPGASSPLRESSLQNTTRTYRELCHTQKIVL